MFENTIEFRVRYSETDQMGVVYHANYLVWCEMGRTELMRGLGVSYASLEDRGILLTVADVGIRYKNAARYDDRIRVRTVLSRVRSRGVSFTYKVEKLDSGVELASAHTDLICLDSHGSTRALPDDVRAALAAARPLSGSGNIGAPSGVE